MNTQSASSFNWSHSATAGNTSQRTTAERKTLEPLKVSTRHGNRVLLAVAPALALIVAVTWVVSTFEVINVLQAAIAVTGFIFLALAIDTRFPTALALAASGVALPALALLSFHVVPEFAILAAVILAGWLAAIIYCWNDQSEQ